MKGIIVEQIGECQICIGGIGKLFYQEGFPIIMSIEELKKKNIEVSFLHIVDELQKHGWPNKTILTRMKEDLEKEMPNIEPFLNAEYEQQREMIFDSLFGNKKNAVTWYKQRFIKVNG